MATTYTSAIKLGECANGDTGWGAVVNADLSLIDSLSPVGDLAVTFHEGGGSASLLVDVAPGNYVKQDGSIGVYAGTTSFALTASNTNYLFLDGTSSYALTKSTSAFPTTPHIRLATVVAGTTTLSSNADSRQSFPVCGSIADGVNWTFGTTTGTQIGTAVGQKLALWGKTPVIQQTGGAATAGATYTATEQGMLNSLYAMARTIGLLS